MYCHRSVLAKKKKTHSLQFISLMTLNLPPRSRTLDETKTLLGIIYCKKDQINLFNDKLVSYVNLHWSDREIFDVSKKKKFKCSFHIVTFLNDLVGNSALNCIKGPTSKNGAC